RFEKGSTRRLHIYPLALFLCYQKYGAIVTSLEIVIGQILQIPDVKTHPAYISKLNHFQLMKFFWENHNQESHVNRFILDKLNQFFPSPLKFDQLNSSANDYLLTGIVKTRNFV
ncbi:hypothetical protein L9F63_018056, partial [Diploptera punctata]